jgi:hypothetical protein
MYNRTVRCRFCGEKGHTYVTCQKAKKQAEDNPNGYWANKLAKRAQSNKERKCSWCGNTNHNKKTCQVLLQDKVKVAIANINFRKNFITNILQKNQLGIGALVSLDRMSGYQNDEYRYDLVNQMALVVDIDLSSVLVDKDYSINKSIQIEFLHIHQYGNKNKKAQGCLSIPNWLIRDPSDPPETNSFGDKPKIGFSVACPGYFEVENAEEWCKDKKAVDEIISKYSNHQHLTRYEIFR